MLLPADLSEKYEVLEPLPGLAPGEQRFLLQRRGEKPDAGRPAGSSLYSALYVAEEAAVDPALRRRQEELLEKMRASQELCLPLIEDWQLHETGYWLVAATFEGAALRSWLASWRGRPGRRGLARQILPCVGEAIDAARRTGWPAFFLAARGLWCTRPLAREGLRLQLPLPHLPKAEDKLYREVAMQAVLHDLAELTLVLLGHPSLSFGPEAREFEPLAELTESQNQMLRQALESTSKCESAAEFVRGFFGLPDDLEEGAGPAEFGGSPLVNRCPGMALQPGEDAPGAAPEEPEEIAVAHGFERKFAFTSRLRLLPEWAGNPVIQLVSGPEFFIGRSAADADFIAQFAPRSPENDRQTLKISRRQLCLREERGEMSLENIGSRNTARIADRPLLKKHALPDNLQLTLPGQYSLSIRRGHSAYRAPRRFQNELLMEGAPLEGAFLVEPGAGQSVMPFVGVWLISDVTVGLADKHRLAILPGEEEGAAVARLHSFGGGFWIQRLSADLPVIVCDEALQPGEVAPLLRDFLVEVGSARYQVHVIS